MLVGQRFILIINYYLGGRGWSEKKEYLGVGLQYFYKHKPLLISFNLTFYLISCMANAGGSYFVCNIVDK